MEPTNIGDGLNAGPYSRPMTLNGEKSSPPSRATTPQTRPSLHRANTTSTRKVHHPRRDPTKLSYARQIPSNDDDGTSDLSLCSINDTDPESKASDQTKKVDSRSQEDANKRDISDRIAKLTKEMEVGPWFCADFSNRHACSFQKLLKDATPAQQYDIIAQAFVFWEKCYLNFIRIDPLDEKKKAAEGIGLSEGVLINVITKLDSITIGDDVACGSGSEEVLSGVQASSLRLARKQLTNRAQSLLADVESATYVPSAQTKPAHSQESRKRSDHDDAISPRRCAKTMPIDHTRCRPMNAQKPENMLDESTLRERSDLDSDATPVIEPLAKVTLRRSASRQRSTDHEVHLESDDLRTPRSVHAEAEHKLEEVRKRYGAKGKDAYARSTTKVGNAENDSSEPKPYSKPPDNQGGSSHKQRYSLTEEAAIRQSIAPRIARLIKEQKRDGYVGSKNGVQTIHLLSQGSYLAYSVINIVNSRGNTVSCISYRFRVLISRHLLHLQPNKISPWFSGFVVM